MLRRLLATRHDAALLILRLALAIMIFPHGAQKMLGWWGGKGFETTLGFFSAKYGVVLGVLAILAEFLGGIGLFLGMFTRVAAAAVAANMLIAASTIHIHNGFFMNWSGQQKGEGIEFFILAVGIALALIKNGGGLWSVDYGLVHQMDKERAREAPAKHEATAAR